MSEETTKVAFVFQSIMNLKLHLNKQKIQKKDDFTWQIRTKGIFFQYFLTKDLVPIVPDCNTVNE